MLFHVITNKRNIFVKRIIYISHHHSWAADVTRKKAFHFHFNLYININLYHERYLIKTIFIENQKENHKNQYHFILVRNILNQNRILQFYLEYDMLYANLIVQQQISGHTYQHQYKEHNQVVIWITSLLGQLQFAIMIMREKA